MSDLGQWLTRLAPDSVVRTGDRAAHFGDVLTEAAIIDSQTTKTPLGECGVIGIGGLVCHQLSPMRAVRRATFSP